MFLLLIMSCCNRRAAGEQFLDDFPDSRLLVLTTVVMRTIVVGWRENISVLCVAAIILTCCSRIGVCTVSGCASIVRTWYRNSSAHHPRLRSCIGIVTCEPSLLCGGSLSCRYVLCRRRCTIHCCCLGCRLRHILRLHILLACH